MYSVRVAIVCALVAVAGAQVHLARAAGHTNERVVTVRALRPDLPFAHVPGFASLVFNSSHNGLRSVVMKMDDSRVAELAITVPHSGYAISTQANFVYHALFEPNDPAYPFQWHLAATNVPRAWDFDATAPKYGGDPSVVVAVLDTGASYEDYQTYRKAPDFALTNFTTGYDFVNSDEHPNDDNGHGTHVTMTIAESTNNALAGAGVAFNTTIMPVKVLDGDGAGTTATIAAGIDYARLHGAKAINLSLGGTDDDPVLHTAVQDAANAGIIVVAATGNDGVSSLYYPAQYDEVIAVGAVRYDGHRAPYSNYGAGIDLVAPGGQLFADSHYSTDPHNETVLDQNNDGEPDGILQQTCVTQACDSFDEYYYEGTSQAAPQVSGAVALLLSAGIDSAHIPTILQNSAKDLGPAGYDTTYGWGLLDVAQALTLAIGDTTPPVGDITLNGGAAFTHMAQVTVTSSVSDATTSVSSMSFSNNGAAFSAWEPYASSKTWDLKGYGATSADGTKTVFARFRDAAGNVSETMQANIGSSMTWKMIHSA